MNSFLSCMAFLSGCLPISIINLIINYKNEDFGIVWFAILFFIITVFAGFCFWYQIKSFYRDDNQCAVISNIKRKDIFASGAISYYVVPFVSFFSQGRDGVIILIVLIILFLWIFNNNRMFLYTPMLDILGYKILECEITISGQTLKANVITNEGSELYFTGENHVSVSKVEENIYVAQILR